MLDAGCQSVFFNEDLGAWSTANWASCMVEEADGLTTPGRCGSGGGVVFGQSAARPADDDDGHQPAGTTAR